jgi:hypothetical protein
MKRTIDVIVSYFLKLAHYTQNALGVIVELDR